MDILRFGIKTSICLVTKEVSVLGEMPDVNYPSRICLAYVDGVIASVQILAILVRNDWPFSFGTGGHFAAEYTPFLPY